MRLDIYLSKVGLIKRRTIAKELADSGMIKVNSRRAKPSLIIKIGDIIQIGGNRALNAEVKNIPTGNVKKEDRESYFTTLDKS
jgi:ribosomal 50S subunit-recycling heat shock protein